MYLFSVFSFAKRFTCDLDEVFLASYKKCFGKIETEKRNGGAAAKISQNATKSIYTTMWYTTHIRYFLEWIPFWMYYTLLLWALWKSNFSLSWLWLVACGMANKNCYYVSLPKWQEWFKCDWKGNIMEGKILRKYLQLKIWQHFTMCTFFNANHRRNLVQF